jgi:outer membrane protein assembly factor BamB
MIQFDNLSVFCAKPARFDFGRHDWQFEKKNRDGMLIIREATRGIRLSTAGALADKQHGCVAVDRLESADSGKALWIDASARYRPSDLVSIDGGKVFLYGYGGGGGYDVSTGRILDEKAPQPPAMPEPPAVPEGVEGTVVGVQKHGDWLIVTTAQGAVYCYADRPTARGVPERSGDAGSAADDVLPDVPPTHGAADELLRKTGVREGYAFVLGLDDGSLVEGLLRRSPLRVVAADPDARKVDAVRRRLDASGLFDDHRLAVFHADAAGLGLPPYIASLITTETSLRATDALRETLRPYGGTLATGRGETLSIERRAGPVAGGGQWTHEYAAAGNSLSSGETVARLPLGILWYEGPAGAARFYFDGDVDHQSGHSVSPLPPGALILDGRMILQGPGRLGAFDVYTGRLLWETEIPAVYGFGGPGGGVGIHSQKHREPWRCEPAMQAEIPATHHARTSGLNYASARDAIYVCAGRELLRLSIEDGSPRSAWRIPLPEADRDDLCWGSVRVAGNRLVATAFRPGDLVDAECGHDGNGGEWSKDRMPMTHLMVLDRRTGKLLWSRRAELGWLNGGIAVGRDAVFCLDTIAPNTLEKFRAAGRSIPRTDPQLYALALADGAIRWRFEPDALVMSLTYAEPRDVLIAPCRHLTTWQDGSWVVESTGRATGRNAPGRMWALRGRDGRVLWRVDEAPYFEPHVIVGDMILDRYGYRYHLANGEPYLRVNPSTGREEPWRVRPGGCNHLVASPTLVTWRTACYDLAGDAGTLPLHGMNAGCTATMLPAGGVLNVPNFGKHHKRPRMTALALIHQPENADVLREQAVHPR